MKWSNDSTYFELDEQVIRQEFAHTVTVKWFCDHVDLMNEIALQVWLIVENGIVPITDWTPYYEFEVGFDNSLTVLSPEIQLRVDTDKFYREGNNIVGFHSDMIPSWAK